MGGDWIFPELVSPYSAMLVQCFMTKLTAVLGRKSHLS